MFKKISFFIFIITFCYSIEALTQNKNLSYPPYPEVWGYDLEDNPLIPEGFEYIISYSAPDNDIVLKFNKCRENCNDPEPSKHKYDSIMLWFFMGRMEKVDDANLYVKNKQLKWILETKEIIQLPNNICIKSYYISTGKYCQENDLLQHALLKGKCDLLKDTYFDSIESVEKYSIIAASKNIYRYIGKEDGRCDRGGPRGGEVLYKQLYYLPLEIIALKDDTFLITDGNLVIRFDGNLQTKFKPIHDVKLEAGEKIKGNFFVLPYSKIQELDDKVARNNDHGVQGLHDELLLYLFRRPENR